MNDWFFEYVFPIIFICMFIIVGGSIALGFLKDIGNFFNGSGEESFDTKLNLSSQDYSKKDRNKAKSSTSYECDNCGAGIEDGDDVSPSGDVKCTHCRKWFNIYNN